MWKTAKAVLLDKRVISVGFLLLAVDFLDIVFLHPIVPELDILEHFLFGFVLSDLASKVSQAMSLDDFLANKLGKMSLRRVDLLVRVFGFTLIGGVLWELSELYIFPLFGFMFGRTPNPFFALPITLHNIDGAIDVTVGAVGCLLAWYF